MTFKELVELVESSGIRKSTLDEIIVFYWKHDEVFDINRRGLVAQLEYLADAFGSSAGPDVDAVAKFLRLKLDKE